MPTGGDVLELVFRRRNVLDRLRVPAEKRELLDALDVSRSTVDRAIRDLELAGLVVWDGDSYRLTAVGRTLLDEANALVEVSDGARLAADVFSSLPADAPLDAAVLRGASFADDETVHGALERLARGASRIRLLVPDSGDPTWLASLREAVWAGATLDVVVSEPVAASLRRQSPAAASVLSADGASASVGTTSPFGLLVTDDAVGLFVSDDDRVLVTDRDAAIAWAETLVDETVSEARPLEIDPSLSDPDFALEREGFVRLSPGYFEANEPNPETCWRAGLGLSEVRAGYAVERFTESDGETTGEKPLSAVLERRLRNGERLAVVGPDGSGKSTVCKGVACRWFEAGDPVLYRESGVGATFDSPSALRAVLKRLDGKPLVVVEDAVKSEAAAVFDLLDCDAAFLFDSTTDEWDGADARLVSARGATARNSVETVAMPQLTADTCRRLREKVAETTGRPVETPVESLLSDGGENQLLSVLHRLVLASDPLAEDPPTTLKEDVRRACAELAEAGYPALLAGVLVNLFNAAGSDVSGAYAYALDAESGAVDEAVRALEGVVLFDDAPMHERWSERFLVELLSVEGEARAHELVSDCLTAWLSLANDDARRERLVGRDGVKSELERLTEAPQQWVVETTRRLLAIGDETPGAAPLFGPPGGERVRWPDAAPTTLPAEYALRRGEMALAAGAYDDAELAFDATLARLSGDESERANRLRADARKHLGTVDNERGDYEAARESYEAARGVYESLGDELGVAQCRNNVGTLAHISGDLDTAHEEYEACIETYRALGVRDDRADTLNNLAVLLKTRGDLHAARERFAEALALYGDVGTPRDEADVLVNLASIALAAGDLDEAERRSRESLDRYRELGAKDGLAWTYGRLGEVMRYRGQFEDAETFLRKAVDACEAVDDPLNRAEALVNLGGVARETGETDAAAAHCTEALEAFRDLGAREEEAAALRELGWLALETNDVSTARKRANTAVTICEDVGNERGAGAAYRLLSAAARTINDTEAAIDAAERARSCANAAGDRYGEAAAIRELAYATENVDQLERAAELFDECGAIRDAIETYQAAIGRNGDAAIRATELAEKHGLTAFLSD